LSKHDFAASANPILYLGASLYLLTAKRIRGICSIALEEAIIDRMTKNKKIKAIITVNLYGMPYKVDEVHAIAEKYGILF
jgi:dTDP-4-amino-4,6-dideoxygalactose transaminase